VSSLDFSNAITLSGFRVPALSSRRTETEVELQDGQTFAIAGLMNNTVNSSMQKIPGIGDIPILGYLFRSRAYQKNQTELVVMITPQIVRRGSMGASEALPSAVEPYLGAPSNSRPQPAPYVGSPRYPAPGGSAPSAQPRRDNNNDAAAANPAPAQMAQPGASQNGATEQKPVTGQRNAMEPKATPSSSAPKPLKGDQKALEQQRENDRRQADAAAKAKAEQDRKDAEAKKIADQKAAEEKARQQKLDEERAKREAEVARKNAEVERQRQAEAKKREKSLSEAAERLRQAQAAYQAEIDKAKGGKGGEPKH
jgi:flagellar biosynthesis GTPase FlhF